MRGEVAQEGRFIGQPEAFDFLPACEDAEDDFYHVVDVALGVGAARDGEAYELHFGRRGEHEDADFYGADAAF